VALLVWLATGFYQIEDGETGVVQHFGAYAGLRPSGAGWHLPWPVETVTAVNLGRLNSADFQARMLTSDAMLVNVTASIQYQYSDARAALFAARDPDALVRELGEAATRELVGARRIEVLMGGAQRAALTTALRAAVQKPLDAMGLGVRVLAVNLTDVQVPQAVLAAQRELVQAGIERERVAREAQGYAAELVPAAQGQAQRQRLDAQAYKLQVVGVAEGDAARFDPIAAAYARAPEVTRTRLYIETMETILARSRKIIIDGKGAGNTLVLPLDKLGEAGALKGAGVSGVLSGSSGAAITPAVTPAPTNPANPANTAGSGARDDRGRERDERQ
jgi:membrane protease subunit HflK